MKAKAVNAATATADEIAGRVLCHTVRRAGGKGIVLRKGQLLQAADLDAVRQAHGELHLLEPEPGDLHEDIAGARLAQAAAGDGLTVTGPVESQYQLVAARRGLLRIDQASLLAVNSIEGLSLFTTFDELAVDEGDNVGSAKVTPILVPERRIAEAEALCRERPPLVVKPFLPRRVFALALDRVDEQVIERFRRDLGAKLRWFGSELVAVERVEDRVEAFVAAIEHAHRAGADVIMAAGASSLDPLEPLFQALDRAGARIVKHGVPAHPGSLFWMAECDTTPIFGLSSCEMFSHKTVLDLVLPRLLAGEPIGREQLMGLAYGGLLNRQMAFRFPDYDGTRKR